MSRRNWPVVTRYGGADNILRHRIREISGMGPLAINDLSSRWAACEVHLSALRTGKAAKAVVKNYFNLLGPVPVFTKVTRWSDQK